MDPLTILAVVNGSLSLAEKLIPVIDTMVTKGEITVAQQQELRAKYESLKAKADGQFSGPAWQVQ